MTTAAGTPHLPAKPDANVIILGALVFAMSGMVLAVAAKVVEIDRKVRILADRHSMTEEEWVARQGALLDQITAAVVERMGSANGHTHMTTEIVAAPGVPLLDLRPDEPSPPMVTRWPDAPVPEVAPTE